MRASTLNAAEAATLPAERPRHATKLRAIALVVICTLFGAASQILIRQGAPAVDASGLQQDPLGFLESLILNGPLLLGHVFLGFNAILLVLALREGQLSVLYPIIALTYVWVAILSPMFFPDTVNVFKIVGVGLIVVGVSFIGLGSREREQ